MNSINKARNNSCTCILPKPGSGHHSKTCRNSYNPYSIFTPVKWRGPMIKGSCIKVEISKMLVIYLQQSIDQKPRFMVPVNRRTNTGIGRFILIGQSAKYHVVDDTDKRFAILQLPEEFIEIVFVHKADIPVTEIIIGMHG